MSATPEAAIVYGYKISRASIAEIDEDDFEKYEEYFFDTDPWGEKGEYVFGITIQKVSDGNPCEELILKSDPKIQDISEIFYKLFGRFAIPTCYLVFRWN